MHSNFHNEEIDSDRQYNTDYKILKYSYCTKATMYVHRKLDFYNIYNKE